MTKTTTFTAIKRINALAELERMGIVWSQKGNNEVTVRCPAHEDKTPSAELNTKTNVWKCWSSQCEAKGDIVHFLALYMQCERATILVDLGTRYDLDDVKVINSETVEKYHQRIKEAGPLLQALRDRGIRDEDIRAGRIGFNNGRITIPVRDSTGPAISARSTTRDS